MMQRNLSMKQKQNHRDRERLVIVKGEEFGGGMDWEFGVSTCKLLYIDCINNKVLLNSIHNYSQYPIINHNEKIKQVLNILCMPTDKFAFNIIERGLDPVLS